MATGLLVSAIPVGPVNFQVTEMVGTTVCPIEEIVRQSEQRNMASNVRIFTNNAAESNGKAKSPSRRGKRTRFLNQARLGDNQTVAFRANAKFRKFTIATATFAATF